MIKFCAVLFAMLTIVTSNFELYGEDRYEYVCKGINGSTYYLDTYSITSTNVPNVFRFWDKDVLSDLEKKRYIDFSNNNASKMRLYKLSYVLCCFEINLAQNKYRIIEEQTYDLDGIFIGKRDYKSSVWENIPPNSVLELMRNAIKRRTHRSIIDKLDAPSIVLIALMTGGTLSTLLVWLYMKLSSPASPNIASSKGTTQTEYDSSRTDKRAEYDFDYPYEDIEKVTGI